MAKRIPQEYYLSGNNECLSISNTFIYEVTIYKVYKDRIELDNTRLYSSNNPLHIKNKSIWEKHTEYQILKCIDLISVPKEYVNSFKKIII